MKCVVVAHDWLKTIGAVVIHCRLFFLPQSVIMGWWHSASQVCEFAADYTDQSPWEANRFSASQETPHILMNPKVHYRFHKRPLTYLLAYSTVQSPSWAATWFAASQEIPRIHYHTHKRPPPVSILGQPNPVHMPTFHLLEIHPNIIHPSTPRSPQWSLSLRFPPSRPYTPPLPTDPS